MTAFVLASSNVRVMLWHMALYGLAAILEDAGLEGLRLSWSPGMQPLARIEAQRAGEDRVGDIVRAHAQRHAAGSWLQRDIVLKGTARGLMSPRLTPFESDAVWRDVQRRRHEVLDALTAAGAVLDLRLLAALGEPAYWSHGRQGEALQDDGASRLEMQPRNQGSEFVGSRLRKLADTVAARSATDVAAGLSGRRLKDEAERDRLDSRTATGFANPGPTDNAVAWCALWGISQLPLVPRVNATATTSGHIGRVRQEWFYLPYWTAGLRPAKVRSLLASSALRTAAGSGLPDRWASRPAEAVTAGASLAARGVTGVVRFPIARFGSDSAPERRALLGDAVPTGVR